jgi:hypothetical protein
MSKIVKITLHRTPEWVWARRVETGENVPEQIDVLVLVEHLPHEVREMLLEAGNGSYPDEFAGDFRHDYRWIYRTKYRYGHVPIIVDSDEPTFGEIAAAILAADAERRRQKAEADEEIRRQEARDKALAEEWARLPLEQRASAAGICVARDQQTGEIGVHGVQVYHIDVLRRYVPEALAEAAREAERLSEIERGKEAMRHLALLAELLSLVPEDALRHALKEASTDGIGGRPSPIEEVRRAVEKACEAGGFPITL